MVLAQKQKYRSMEQDRKPKDKPRNFRECCGNSKSHSVPEVQCTYGKKGGREWLDQSMGLSNFLFGGWSAKWFCCVLRLIHVVTSSNSVLSFRYHSPFYHYPMTYLYILLFFYYATQFLIEVQVMYSVVLYISPFSDSFPLQVITKY